MKWISEHKPLDEYYLIDDLIDLYLEVQSRVLFGSYYKEEIKYYQHCYDCLSRAFGFDLSYALVSLDVQDRELIKITINNILQIETPTLGRESPSIMLFHRKEMSEIISMTRELIELYREFIAQILNKRFDIKEKVSKEELLKAGYDKTLIPDYWNFFDS
ncbi:MAG: hypothetical protein U0W24_11245 [Bacteroidales bacterium]